MILHNLSSLVKTVTVWFVENHQLQEHNSEAEMSNSTEILLGFQKQGNFSLIRRIAKRVLRPIKCGTYLFAKSVSCVNRKWLPETEVRGIVRRHVFPALH